MSMLTQVVTPNTISKKLRLYFLGYLYIWLPLLLGLSLAPVLAALTIGGLWFLALPIVLVVPAVILLNRYPFAAIMIWMAILPFFPFNSEFSLVYYTFHRTLIPLTLGIIIFGRMLRFNAYQPIRLVAADWSTFIFGVLGIASIFISGKDSRVVLTIFDRILVPFLIYWIIRLSHPGMPDIRRVIWLAAVLCLAESVIGLLSWFAPELLLSIWHSNMQGDRVVGTFGEPAAYAIVLMFYMLFVFYGAVSGKKGWRQTVLLVIFGLGMVCILFTFTRSCWLAGIFVVLGLLYLYPKITGMLLLITVPTMLFLSSGLLVNEFAHAYQRFNDEETADDRVILVHAGQQMFLARPIFGWGYSNYDRYDWKFMERVDNAAPGKWHIQYGTSHHTYITILAEMGLVGFFFYALPVIWWLTLTIKRLPQIRKMYLWNWRFVIILWMIIGFQIIVAQFVDLRYFFYAHATLWLSLGLIANIVQDSSKVSQEKSLSSSKRVALFGTSPHIS